MSLSLNLPRLLAVGVLVTVMARCSPTTGPTGGSTPATHTWFPITPSVTLPTGATVADPHEYQKVTESDGPVACESCHVNPDGGAVSTTFMDYSCTLACHGSHPKPVVDVLHSSLNALPILYDFGKCFACHPFGTRTNAGFDHLGADHARLSQGCPTCHSAGQVYHRLAEDAGAQTIEADGGAHPAIGSGQFATDCGACHSSTTDWRQVSGGSANNINDPSRNVQVAASVPVYSGTSIDRVTATTEVEKMMMVHGDPSAAGMACATCHPGATAGAGYFPGVFHSSLSSVQVVSACNGCHKNAMPTGFVGVAATNPARAPSTGEMKHDAVTWTNGVPTTTALVTQDCVLCHAAPTATVVADWTTAPVALGHGVSQAAYHAALAAGGRAQPSQCLDCHANTRPVTKLTSTNASLPVGMAFDHQSPSALGECITCHAKSAIDPVTSWAGGRFHASNSVTPTTCLPCHASERPTSTTKWASTSYTASPFDYVTNSLNVTHGDGLDCVSCHNGPGSGGAWGGTETWVGGTFAHGAGVASTGCVNCHVSERPDLMLGSAAAAKAVMPGNFDHSLDGTGDCGGCHEATVVAGRYVDYYAPGTHVLPGGDWKSGRTYPGNYLVSSTLQFIVIDERQLVPNASAPSLFTQTPNVILGDRRYNGMLHTSTIIDPTSFGIYPDGGYDTAQCWHCHTHDSTGKVTAFQNGQYHPALANYSSSPSSITGPAIAQPTTQCTDCHAQMLPPNIVMRDGGFELQAIDHSAPFKSAVTLGGQSVTAVSETDCSVCHKSPGGSWADGLFHANIGGAQPTQCVNCHLLLMAKTASSNVTFTPVKYPLLIDHWAPSLTFQSCETCHTGALAKGANTPRATTLWSGGMLHSTVGSQPTTCARCHAVSTPSAPTTSSVTYTFAAGGTGSNGPQWMSHSASPVQAQDCVVCHATDAKASGSAWSTSVSFHANAPAVTTCSTCHGGSTPGTNNNLPAGLTSSTTVTSAATDTTTGIATGTLDQLSHSDFNVTSHDCNFCHTQAGTSTTAGIQGKEWAQATFHANFNTANPLVVNGSTGRCSNCHMNVKPTAGFATDHSTYTASSASDCSLCHSWPGSNTPGPNWLNASGGHAKTGSTTGSTLDCNSCHGQTGTATQHLAVAAASHYQGITNGNSCISCHVDFTAFSGPVTYLKYAHTNSSANSGGCQACHSYVSGTYTTKTTTPTMPAGGKTFSNTTNVTASHSGKSFTAAHTATLLAVCGSCHQYTTTTATASIWTFKHKPSNPGISSSKSANGCHECH